MKHYHKKRLLKLAKFLLTVPEEQFNMKNWALKEKNGKPACGTVACACGWATTIPSFRKAGFRLVGTEFRPDLEYKGSYQFYAAAKFFDITTIEAEYLFHPCSYGGNYNPKIKTVSNRIKKFVADRS